MNLRTNQLKARIARVLEEMGVKGAVVDKVNPRGELVIAVVIDEVCPHCGGSGKKRYAGEAIRLPPPPLWSTTCSRCLASSPSFASEDMGRRTLEADPLWWELREDGLRWCLACARDVRAVKMYASSRRKRR